MTHAELVSEVSERLNLTSATALTRIGRSVNEVYREVAASIGLQTTSRTTVTASTAVGMVNVLFGGIQQVTTITAPDDAPNQPLEQLSFIELRQRVPHTGSPARAFAVERIGSNTVLIRLDAIPASVYVLQADGIANQVVLTGAMEPAMPENFHNVLIHGAMVIELQKMEQYDMAASHEAQFEKRLGELRYFLAKSAWLTIHQGKSAVSGVIPPAW